MTAPLPKNLKRLIAKKHSNFLSNQQPMLI